MNFLSEEIMKSGALNLKYLLNYLDLVNVKIEQFDQQAGYNLCVQVGQTIKLVSSSLDNLVSKQQQYINDFVVTLL